MSHHEQGCGGGGSGHHHEQGGAGGHGGACGSPQGGGHAGHPDDAERWSHAFFHALREVKTDILKEKIRERWGKELEAVADEVVEAMGQQWKAVVQMESAQDSLRDAVRRGYDKGAK